MFYKLNLLGLCPVTENSPNRNVFSYSKSAFMYIDDRSVKRCLICVETSCIFDNISKDNSSRCHFFRSLFVKCTILKANACR